MRYRIALCGFSEFEHRALSFSFAQPTRSTDPAYEIVDNLAEADFAVVDADAKPAVKGVVQSGRAEDAVFVGAKAPADAGKHLPRPIDPTRILRTLDELVARHERRAAHAGIATTLPDELHELRDLHELRHPHDPHDLRQLPTLQDIVVLPHAPIEAAAVVPPPPGEQAAPNAAKAAARAKARRARMALDRTAAGSDEPLSDALVLDADAAANASLCALLERFGFVAQGALSVEQALAGLAQRPFAAVFVDVRLDDAGLALLQRIRAAALTGPHPDPAVLVVAARPDPADRVRAVLAGLPEPLVKPLARGAVARALESAGVVLPADARRF